MDDKFMLDGYIYPRIFELSNYFKEENKIWNSIVSMRYFSRSIKKFLIIL